MGLYIGLYWKRRGNNIKDLISSVKKTLEFLNENIPDDIFFLNETKENIYDIIDFSKINFDLLFERKKKAGNTLTFMQERKSIYNASLVISCGSSSEFVDNSLVLKFKRLDVFNSKMDLDFLYIFKTLISFWDPKHGFLDSPSLRGFLEKDIGNQINTYNRIGYFTYINPIIDTINQNGFCTETHRESIIIYPQIGNKSFQKTEEIHQNILSLQKKYLEIKVS